MWYRLIKIIAFTLAALLIGVGVVTALCLQDSAQVMDSQVTDAQTAINVRDFLRRTSGQILQARQPVVVSLSANELNSALGLAGHALPGLSGRINIEPFGLLGATTYIIPPTPLGRYLNATVYVHPSNHGLSIEYVQLGDMKLGRKATAWLLRTGLNLLLGQKQGSLLLDSIRQVSFESGRAHVLIDPPPNLHARIDTIKNRFKFIRDKTAFYGDPQQVRHYYRALMAWTQHHGDIKTVSLTQYLIPLFSEAKRQSIHGDAVSENRAALLALAIYLGHSRFETFIGNVRDAQMRAFKTPVKVVLAGRRDLRLHFVFSAAFKILSDQGFSMALGEYKELIDSGSGGSGFSFADLAADRSGIFFAQLATDSESQARQLQNKITSGITEAEMFPPIQELPEGLTQSEFTRQYDNVDSEAYLAMVQMIDARIRSLALYQ